MGEQLSAKREEQTNHLDQQSVLLIPPDIPSTSSLFETLTVITEQDYRYSLLPNPKTYIRLLKLTADGEEIVSSLEAFPVSEVPDFCALSYAWGDAPPTSIFICSSARLPVTEHLLWGMKRVHRCNPTPWIWIDAICINQTDHKEKADQIPLMEKIYSLAQHVLVYLGEATRQTEEALDQLKHIRDCIQNANGPIFRGGSSRAEGGLPATEGPFWKTLADFYCRSWFQRLWILQEVILAKDVVFICGSRVIGFELLGSSSFQLYQADIYKHLKELIVNAKDIQGYATLINLGHLRDEITKSPLNLLPLLHQGRNQRVKEPVDRVYGLLGMVEAWVKQEVVVDYSPEARAQYWKLYISVAKLIVKSGELDLLTIAASEERPPQLPSWIPNWNSRQSTATVAAHFHAGFHPKDKFLFEDILIPNSDSIQLRGFRVGPIFGTSPLEYKNYKDTKELMGPEVCHDPENVLLRRLARTLVADTGSLPGTSHSDNDHKYLQDAREDYVWYRAYLSDLKRIRGGTDSALTQEKMRQNAGPYALNRPTQWRNRSLFVTPFGLLGLCSQSCQSGDIICILLSAKHPCVLRKVPNKSSFTLVSCAYCDVVVYGEALDLRDTTKDEIFIID